MPNRLAGTRKPYLAQVTTVPLLLIDDLCMRKLPHTAAEDLLEIVMRRHERASTLITSNRPVEDWGKLLGDTAAVTALLDRLLHHAYRTVRRDLLEAYGMVTRLKFPDARHVIGIATEPWAFDGGRSEDLLYLDATGWNDEVAAEATELQRDLGLLEDTKRLKRLSRNIRAQETCSLRREEVAMCRVLVALDANTRSVVVVVRGAGLPQDRRTARG